MTSLPSRLTERSFRRFEPDIARIVDEYPNAIELSAKRLSMQNTTYRARLADAMLSLKDFRWTTTIDMEKYDILYNDIVISHKGDRIIAGSSKAVKDWRPTSTTLPSPVAVSIVDRQAQAALADAIASGHAPPTRVSGLSDADVEFLKDNFDVAITKYLDGTYIIK